MLRTIPAQHVILMRSSEAIAQRVREPNSFSAYCDNLITLIRTISYNDSPGCYFLSPFEFVMPSLSLCSPMPLDASTITSQHHLKAH